MDNGTARLPALGPVVHAEHLLLQSRIWSSALLGLGRCLLMLKVPLRERWDSDLVNSVKGDSYRAVPHERAWRLIYLTAKSTLTASRTNLLFHFFQQLCTGDIRPMERVKTPSFHVICWTDQPSLMHMHNDAHGNYLPWQPRDTLLYLLYAVCMIEARSPF